jgi:hypothetical protein
MSVLDGPGEGAWSVFAQKAVEERDEARAEVRRLRDVGAVSIEKPQRKMRQRKSSVAEGSVEKPRRPRGRPRKTQVDDPKSSLN